MPRLVILHTNDLHGKLDSHHLPFLKSLREDADLYFDTGDCIQTGNLGIPLKQELVWSLLAEARCDLSIPGNRESHVMEAVMKKKFEGVNHPVICANWHGYRDTADPFPPTWRVEINGIRIGVVGVMVPMVTERMTSRHASQYIWEQPIPRAIELGKQLRREVDLLIAMTHIGITQDRQLAEGTEDFDAILGAHSHTVLEQPEVINGTPICQGGSHGRFIGRYVWENGHWSGELIPWQVTS